MKKLFSVVLSVIIVVAMAVPVLAHDNKKFVSSEDIQTRLSQVYEKYNVEYEFLSRDSTKLFTEEEVTAEVLQLENSIIDSLKPIELGIVELEPVKSRAMPINHRYTTYANANNGITGNAVIELTCDATCNAAAGLFMSINNISSRQYGAATGFVSWIVLSTSYSMLNGGSQANIQVVGNLTTEVNILGITQRASLDHVVGMIISSL